MIRKRTVNDYAESICWIDKLDEWVDYQCEQKMIFGKTIYDQYFEGMGLIELQHLLCSHGCPTLKQADRSH